MRFRSRRGRTHPIATVLVLWLAAACDSNSSPSAPTVDPPDAAVPIRRAVVLGDSLAVSPSLDQSFPARLQARVDRQGLRWTVVNAGISGDTSSGGLRRLEPLLAGTGVLVLALGANDGLSGVPVATVESNLATIVETAQRRSVRVLLCGMETPPTHGFDYSIAFHQVFPRLADRFGIPLVPFLLAGVALDPSLNLPDGVHPNAAGAERIADTIWPYLLRILQQG
jgi:acyl-CoA thioesterase-1